MNGPGIQGLRRMFGDTNMYRAESALRDHRATPNTTELWHPIPHEYADRSPASELDGGDALRGPHSSGRPAHVGRRWLVGPLRWLADRYRAAP